MAGCDRSARIGSSRLDTGRGKKLDDSDDYDEKETVADAALQALTKGRALLMRGANLHDHDAESSEDVGADPMCRAGFTRQRAGRKDQLTKAKARGPACEYSREGDMAWLEGKVRRLQQELEAFLADGGGESGGAGALRDLQIALAAVVGISESGIQNLISGPRPASSRPHLEAKKSVDSSTRPRKRRQGEFEREDMRERRWGGRDTEGQDELNSLSGREEDSYVGDRTFAERSRIVAAVDGLRDFLDIDSMTPWFRQASFGVHVGVRGRASAPGYGGARRSNSHEPSRAASLRTQPLESQDARPGSTAGLRAGMCWSPPGSPANELTSTEMVASMMQGRWAEVRAELERQESGLAEHRSMVLRSGQQLVNELADTMEALMQIADDTRQAERRMLEAEARQKQLESQCAQLHEEVGVLVSSSGLLLSIPEARCML